MIQMKEQHPNILVVDDEPDEVRTSLQMALRSQAKVTVKHPANVEPEDLGWAHLVLMDYRLEDWPEREKLPAACNVRTGLALATVLREVADEQVDGLGGRLTAFALHTGHLGELSGRIRPTHAVHVVARLNNVEWVFEKSDQHLHGRVVQLARAAQHLQGDWPADPFASEARARDLLSLDPQADWYERAWEEVLECQPPGHQLGGSGEALFLRWLLHQILPYPCFLWGPAWVAARLRIGVDDLMRLTASDCALARDLERIKYRGILAGFGGNRWWRTAVEDYAWELGRRSSGLETFERRLREKAGENVQVLKTLDPVVCVDRDFQPRGVVSPEHAVRVRPEYWPTFVDTAWMSISAVRDTPELRAMVLPLDRYRIDPDE